MDIGNYKKWSRYPWSYLVSRSHDLWLDAGVPGGAIRAEKCDGINVSLAAAIVRGVVGVTTVNRSRWPTRWAGRGSTDRQDVLRDAGAAHGTRPVRVGFKVAVVASGKQKKMLGILRRRGEKQLSVRAIMGGSATGAYVTLKLGLFELFRVWYLSGNTYL